MIKKNLLITIFIFSLIIITSSHASEIRVIRNTTYKSYLDKEGSEKRLEFDLYSPKILQKAHLPLAVLLHGGGFHAGEKEDPKIVELCERLAKEGFLAAAVEYRTGIERYSEKHFVKALLKAVYDAGDFMNHIYLNSNELKVDTTNIFMGGISAGSIVALHLSYWDKEEIITYLEENRIELHLPDRISSFPKARGLLNCWGVLLDPEIMANNNIPIVSVHGEDDRIAPFKKGHPMHIPWLPKVYGSSFIHSEAEKRNITSLFYSYADIKHGHEENTPHMDTTFNMINSFMTYISSGQSQNISLLLNKTNLPKLKINNEDILDNYIAILSKQGNIAEPN